MANKDRKGRTEETGGVFYPVAPSQSDMPEWYVDMLQEIKELVIQERKSAIWTANVRMSMMYYHIGQHILKRQEKEGWGAKVIDRLSADLKEEFPEIRGFSPRNLNYMLRFADCGRMKIFCNGALQNCLGGIIFALWKSVKNQIDGLYMPWGL